MFCACRHWHGHAHTHTTNAEQYRSSARMMLLELLVYLLCCSSCSCCVLSVSLKKCRFFLSLSLFFVCYRPVLQQHYTTFRVQIWTTGWMRSAMNERYEVILLLLYVYTYILCVCAVVIVIIENIPHTLQIVWEIKRERENKRESKVEQKERRRGEEAE